MNEPVSGAAQPSLLKRWLHEPLLHFLLIGFMLFAAYSALNPGAYDRNSSSHIQLTKDDLQQMVLVWTSQWQRPPTPAEMQGLIESKVREEILYREALALGLDQGDTIVKRRLAQKLEFLAEDVSGVRDPSTTELKAWFSANRERFALPQRVTFRHLYFSPDRHGALARDTASQALAALAGKPANALLPKELADRFAYQDYYAEREPQQVAGVFGTAFSKALFQLKPGAWQGPVESGLGWHLVFIESITPGSIPAFEQVESEVKDEWLDAQRVEAKRRMFDAMRSRYDVVLPKDLP